MVLRSIGRFCHGERHCPCGFPRAQLMADPHLDDVERTAVAAWLREGQVFARDAEPSPCRFGCGPIEGGDDLLTDGTWLWPQSLLHYVEHHQVRLPFDVRTHIAGASSEPNRPAPLEHDDHAWWRAWAAEQAYTGDKEGHRTVGFWRRAEHGDDSDVRALPWPGDFVDERTDPAQRARMVRYLTEAPEVASFRGHSPCRLCQEHNGSTDRSDGTFLWPEGLAHYVDVHHVRLPFAFVEHILSQPG